MNSRCFHTHKQKSTRTIISMSQSHPTIKVTTTYWKAVLMACFMPPCWPKWANTGKMYYKQENTGSSLQISLSVGDVLRYTRRILHRNCMCAPTCTTSKKTQETLCRPRSTLCLAYPCLWTVAALRHTRCKLHRNCLCVPGLRQHRGSANISPQSTPRISGTQSKNQRNYLSFLGQKHHWTPQ